MRHTLDIMHIEKNVVATLVDLLLGETDSIAFRRIYKMRE